MLETYDYIVTFILSTLELEESVFNRTKIQNQLEQTIGYLGTEKVYRKHYVIALNLWLGLENNLISGEGAKFDQNKETTRRYLEWQRLQDNKLGLVVPLEYSAESLLATIDPLPVKDSNKFGIGFLSF